MHLSKAKITSAMEQAEIDSFKVLSQKCGVTRATLSYIASGKGCTLETAKKIADALGVELSQIKE